MLLFLDYIGVIIKYKLKYIILIKLLISEATLLPFFFSLPLITLLEKKKKKKKNNKKKKEGKRKGEGRRGEEGLCILLLRMSNGPGVVTSNFACLRSGNAIFATRKRGVGRQIHFSYLRYPQNSLRRLVYRMRAIRIVVFVLTLIFGVLVSIRNQTIGNNFGNGGKVKYFRDTDVMLHKFPNKIGNIPKVIHQTWKTKNLPKWAKLPVKSWKRLNQTLNINSTVTTI